MDQTQAYLARVLPWSEYPEAYRNIHFKGKTTAEGQTLMPGDGCKTIQEAMAAAAYIGSKYVDTFICMSLQAEAKPREQAMNGTPRRPYAVRKKANAIGSKAFYLDMDVKDKGYSNTADALRALSAFVNQFSVPKPTTITASGGGGIHAIWIMDKVIQPSEWLIIARALSTAANSAGLIFDANVTNNIATLLRLPGSFNSKYSPMKLCHTLGQISPHDVPVADFKKALAKFLPDNVVAFPSLAPLPKQSEFSAGVTPQSKPVEMAKLAAACGVVKDALADHGAQHSGGGIWPLMVLATTFVEDGRRWAHELSSGHPGYSPQATDNKYDEKVLARKSSNNAIGWPSCSTLHNAFPTGACNTCPHRQANKTPFHFLDPASPAATGLPAPYYQNHGGVWANEARGEETDTVHICAYQVADPWLDKSPDGAAQINFKFLLEGKQVGVASVPGDKITAQAISPLMARQDLFLDPEQIKPFMGFTMSWIKQLQAATGNGESTPALGWVGHGDQPVGFAYDNITYTPTGQERAARSDTMILTHWTPRGELAPWKQAAAFITGQHRPGLEAILAASFAGPLVRFTGHKGLLASAYSPETGIGKTTAMSIAAAVWGHPTDSAQALDDTPLSGLKRLGAIQSLPFFWDEVRLSSQDKTDKLATLIFALTTGRERTRLNANATMQVAGKWQTLMITASNQSILEIAREATKGSDAGGVRVFEWRVAPALAQSITSSEATRIGAVANSNYGRAGAVYAEWLGANHASAQRAVEVLSDALNKECNAVPDERFWISSMAVILAGAAIARKLGLVDFNLPELKTFCLETLAALRLDRVTTPAIGAESMPRLTELLGMYLSEAKYDRTLETSPAVPGPVKIEPGAERLRILDVHIENATGFMHLRTAAFYNWLREHGLQRKSTLEGLRTNTGAFEQRIVLGAHTSHSTRSKVSAISIPIKALAGVS